MLEGAQDLRQVCEMMCKAWTSNCPCRYSSSGTSSLSFSSMTIQLALTSIEPHREVDGLGSEINIVPDGLGRPLAKNAAIPSGYQSPFINDIVEGYLVPVNFLTDAFTVGGRETTGRQLADSHRFDLIINTRPEVLTAGFPAPERRSQGLGLARCPSGRWPLGRLRGIGIGGKRLGRRRPRFPRERHCSSDCPAGRRSGSVARLFGYFEEEVSRRTYPENSRQSGIGGVSSWRTTAPEGTSEPDGTAEALLLGRRRIAAASAARTIPAPPIFAAIQADGD